MTRIELTLADIEDIEEAMDDPSLSDKCRTKLLVIRMHTEGAKHGFIAKCLKLHGNTITNYLKEWMSGGLPTVLEDKCYRPSSSMEPFMKCLPAALRRPRWLTPKRLWHASRSSAASA